MKFKSRFRVPTKDLKGSEYVMLDVIMPDLELFDGIDIEYKVSIPDFMFDELADTEPKFSTNHDPNIHGISGLFSKRTITRKFQKTQSSFLLSSLKDYVSDLTDTINSRHSIETETMKKKLFIKFEHDKNHTRSNLNGAYHGLRISQIFKYFVGYEVTTKKFRKIGDEKPKKQYITKILYATGSLAKHDTGFKEKDDLFIPLYDHNQSIENFEQEYSIIDWTQEREDYLKKIQDTLTNINEELSSFLRNIDNDKIDMLMSTNPLKLLK